MFFGLGFLFLFFNFHINRPKSSLNVCTTVCNWKALRWKGRIRIWKVWMGKGNTSDGIRKARKDYCRLFKKKKEEGKEFAEERIWKMRFRLLYHLCLPVSPSPKDIDTDDLNWHWSLNSSGWGKGLMYYCPVVGLPSKHRGERSNIFNCDK